MRITWNISDSRFEAELTPGDMWRDDLDSVKLAGFKTTGEPGWIWYASNHKPLNKLRSKSPKSGITITALALEKFNFLNLQNQEKSKLKKQFEKVKKLATSVFWKEELDPETGVICAVIPPTESKFKLDYVRPVPPKQCCFMCGQPLYCFDEPDICLWCAK
jgi:hypothetical protein